jgi:CDP-diacylglycerol---glycerol-3-phosphate 3-phosphatidyltransferase
MLESFRSFWTTSVAEPIGRLLLGAGVSPDAVTMIGSLGSCVAALWLLPTGQLVAGTIVLTVLAFFDLIDGTMARLSGRSSSFGAFLDSTMDRVADGAIFGGLVLYYAGSAADGSDESTSLPWGVDGSGLGVVLALYCVVMGMTTSYARARAESLGFDARVGLAGRSDRLVLIAVAALVSSLTGTPEVLLGGLALLVVASTITVAQRVLTVRRQAVTRGR